MSRSMQARMPSTSTSTSTPSSASLAIRRRVSSTVLVSVIGLFLPSIAIAIIHRAFDKEDVFILPGPYFFDVVVPIAVSALTRHSCLGASLSCDRRLGERWGKRSTYGVALRSEE